MREEPPIVLNATEARQATNKAPTQKVLAVSLLLALVAFLFVMLYHS
jgi:hypothetical protein